MRSIEDGCGYCTYGGGYDYYGISTYLYLGSNPSILAFKRRYYYAANGKFMKSLLTAVFYYGSTTTVGTLGVIKSLYQLAAFVNRSY
jgi:hypothetical protein